MTDEGVAARCGEICPHLGLTEDPTVRYLGVSSSHRCRGGPGPNLISAREQLSYCLSAMYPSCPRWQEKDELLELEDDDSLFGWDWAELRDRAGMVALDLLTGLVKLAWPVAVVGAFILLAPLLGSSDPATRARGMPSGASPDTERAVGSAASGGPAVSAPSSASIASAPAAATPTGVVSSVGRAPLAAPVSNPSPAPSPAPTVAPVAQKAPSTPVPRVKTYVVQSKDTLWSVARAHGVNVDDLAAANGLKDKNVLRAGQKLTIPEPRGRP